MCVSVGWPQLAAKMPVILVAAVVVGGPREAIISLSTRLTFQMVRRVEQIQHQFFCDGSWQAQSKAIQDMIMRLMVLPDQHAQRS